jgi:hypothetical protein
MSRLFALFGLFSGALLASAGCSTAPPDPSPPPLTTVVEWTPAYGSPVYEGQATTASALVFTPHVAANEPLASLDRTSRQPGAFLGYDEGSTEVWRITVDDRQVFSNGTGSAGWGVRGGGFHGGFAAFGSGFGWADRYDRQVYSERTGSIRR